MSGILWSWLGVPVGVLLALLGFGLRAWVIKRREDRARVTSDRQSETHIVETGRAALDSACKHISWQDDRLLAAAEDKRAVDQDLTRERRENLNLRLELAASRRANRALHDRLDLSSSALAGVTQERDTLLQLVAELEGQRKELRQLARLLRRQIAHGVAGVTPRQRTSSRPVERSDVTAAPDERSVGMT